MSLGRVSLKAHKMGYALESFEKVQYRMIVICTLDVVISVFYDFTPLYYDPHQAVPREKIPEISVVKIDSSIDCETESGPINEEYRCKSNR